MIDCGLSSKRVLLAWTLRRTVFELKKPLKIYSLLKKYKNKALKKVLIDPNDAYAYSSSQEETTTTEFQTTSTTSAVKESAPVVGPSRGHL